MGGEIFRVKTDINRKGADQFSHIQSFCRNNIEKAVIMTIDIEKIRIRDIEAKPTLKSKEKRKPKKEGCYQNYAYYGTIG